MREPGEGEMHYAGPPHPLRSQVLAQHLLPQGEREDGAASGTVLLASSQPVRISDIRRGTMIACQILQKPLALAAAPVPSGNCTKLTAKKSRDGRARRLRQVQREN